MIRALDRKLAMEVQKLGHSNLNNVITVARYLECLHKEYPMFNMDSFMSIMQDKLKATKTELKEAHTAAAATAINHAVHMMQHSVASTSNS